MMYLFWIAFVLLGSFTPWWIFLVLSLLVGFFSSSIQGLVTNSFFGGAASWLFVAYYFDYQSQMSVSRQFAKMFSLPGSLSFMLAIAVFAGTISVISAGLGYWLRLMSQSGATDFKKNTARNLL